MMDTFLEYDLVSEAREGYLFACVRTAVLTPELSHKVLRDIRNAVLDARTGRLMFEYELAHALTEEESFHLMNELTGIMPGMRIAFVSRDSRHRPSLNVGVTFGLDIGEEIRSFTDPTAAENWLLDD